MGKLDSIIRAEVNREIKRRKFLDKKSKDEDEDIDIDRDIDIDDFEEDVDVDKDYSFDEDVDVDVDDEDVDVDVDDEDVDVDVDDEDVDVDVDDEDEEDERRKRKRKAKAKDSLSSLTRTLLQREVKRQLSKRKVARDGWRRLSNDMQRSNHKNSVMDKRDERMCNAWKKTIDKES